jgi:hypothetical protein
MLRKRLESSRNQDCITLRKSPVTCAKRPLVNLAGGQPTGGSSYRQKRRMLARTTKVEGCSTARAYDSVATTAASHTWRPEICEEEKDAGTHDQDGGRGDWEGAVTLLQRLLLVAHGGCGSLAAATSQSAILPAQSKMEKRN